MRLPSLVRPGVGRRNSLGSGNMAGTRVQPRLWGGAVVTYTGCKAAVRQSLPGMDERAVRQLDADAVRAWLERLRDAEVEELVELPELG